MPLPFRHALRPLAVTATLLLAACGGGEADTVANSVGVLTDSPVQGVQVLNVTRGSLSGLTGSGGRFEYQPGDLMIFQIGELAIGVVTGTGSAMTVTPLQLIEGMTAITPAERENAVTNVLVLLQSLDADGNPGNGITISAAARAALSVPAVADTLQDQLDAPPATFAALPEFTDLVADLGNTPVPAATALAHFQEQFLEQLAGTYVFQDRSAFVSFRFRTDGAYVMAEIDNAGGGGTPGVERGSIDWNAANGRFTSTQAVDTNGNWGLSDIEADGPVQLTMNAGDLVLTRRNGEGDVVARFRFDRVTNSSTGIPGPWVRGDDRSAMAAQQYIFFANGDYVLMDPVGDESGEACGGTGIEFGRWRTENGFLVFGAPEFDTNGCDGGYDSTTSTPLIAAAFLNSGIGALQIGPELGGMLLLRPDNSAP